MYLYVCIPYVYDCGGAVRHPVPGHSRAGRHGDGLLHHLPQELLHRELLSVRQLILHIIIVVIIMSHNDIW